MLEIGVGTGMRFGLWLDKFRALDQERGTDYYPKLRILLGDYSLATLEMSKPAVKDHADLCSFLVLDAQNPLKTLSFLRHKIMQVHSTNVYDNLPDEEMARRDGKTVFRAGAGLHSDDARWCAYAPYSILPWTRLRNCVHRLLDGSIEFLGDTARGVAFWQDVWRAIRLEERLVQFEDLPDFPFPEGLDAAKLEDILQGCAQRFPFPSEFGRAGKLHQHASAAASARLYAGARYFRHRFLAIPAGFLRSGKTGRIAAQLGQRCFTERGGGARRLQRAFRSVSLPQRIARTPFFTRRDETK